MYLLKRYCFIFMLGLAISGWAQVTDDFSDNDLTANPSWSGNIGSFTGTSGVLRSNGPAASSNIYISIPFNPLNDDLEWHFLVDLTFAPSTTNYLRVYLAADNIDLKNTSLSGYFLQIRKGTSSPKTLDIYKRNGLVETALFTNSGVCFASSSANYSNVRIKVTKSNAGLWSVYSDCNGGINYNFEGSFTENSITNTSVFGFNCIYSTGTRFNQYSFDDLYIGPVQTVTSPPVVVTVPAAIVNYKDLVINELMADPSPTIGLPDIEYLELYNQTNTPFDLHNFKLTDGTIDRVFTQPVTIAGDAYLVICSNTTNKNLLESAMPGIKVITLSGLSLSNTNDNLSLKDSYGNVVDRVNYTDKWYNDNTKSDGGWSLELIDPSSICSGQFNWSACINQNGGTPGSQNSVFAQIIKSDPKITSVLISSPDQIRIAFDGPMDSLSLKTGTYLLGENIKVDQIIFSNPFADTVTARLSASLVNGQLYMMTLTGLKDCAQNLLKENIISFGTGKIPAKDEVVINEIFADETPGVGLPEAEFIELFNTTDQLVDLSGFQLKDKSTTGKIPSEAVIKPHGYIILCSASHVSEFKYYGVTYGVSSFPSLNATDEIIMLVDATGKQISRVNYKDSWYKDAIKKDGGWTLEKIDPANPCEGEGNWTASIDPSGGTPGKQNSVIASNPDVEAPKISGAFAIAADTLLLDFNEDIDSLSIQSAFFNISDNRSVSGLKIFPDHIKLIVTPLFNYKIQYTVTVSGVSDCMGNFMTKTSIPFSLTTQADSLDIIINELLFNPLTGGADFVEIYNNSEKYIDLKDWQLANISTTGGIMANSKTIITLNHVLKPKEYRVFTTDKLNILNNYPKCRDTNFVQMLSMPSYNDDEGVVFLINNQGVISDRFNYSSDYHNKLVENKEGVSLERIGFSLPANNPASWTSAAASAGFATPGYHNSQLQDLVISGNPVSIEPKVFTPDQDGVFDFTTIHFKTEGIGKVGSIIIYDAEGREVRKLVKNETFSNYGLYQWDGSDENGHKARIGYYMVYIELFDLKGNINTYKEKVIIAAKF